MKIKLTVSCSTINKFHEKYLKETSFEKAVVGNYRFLFEIDLRECIMGEYYLSNSHM